MTGRFHIPLDNQRPLFGVFLACHAIPDAVDMIHTGVGCKPKAQRQISSHDRMREAQNKMVWTDVDESLLITGSSEMLVNMTVETYERRDDVGLMVITTSSAMEMTSLDIEMVLPQIRERVDCPVIHIPTPGYEGDLHVGYQKTIQAVLELCDWSRPARSARSVNLLGYLFHRYENDHAMSLHELRRLLSSLDIDVVTTLLSGTPTSALFTAPRAGSNVILPWAGSIVQHIETITHRPCRMVDLPLGVSSTTRFLRDVGSLVGVPRPKIEALAAHETRRIEPLLRIATERLAGTRVAVLADTPMAAGLCSFIRDLSMIPVLVGLLDRTLGGRGAFDASVERSGFSLHEMPVMQDPCSQDVEAAFANLAASGSKPQILVAPDVWLPPSATEGVARVEIGIPSNRKHAIYAQPLMGYRGAVALAQRFMDAGARVF